MGVFLLGAGLSGAEAAKGSVAGTEFLGYARIVFDFDDEVVAKARVLNSVLVVEFDQAVTLDVNKLSQQLPGYVSVARVDPDGRSVRVALNDRFRADIKIVGERVFLDLLSPRWKGAPPPLPPDVIQELVRRARRAEDKLRRMTREQERKGNRAIELKIGNAPQFRRAIFTMPYPEPVTFTINDDTISLIYDAGFTLSETLVRQRMAGLIRDVDIESATNVLRITLILAEGLRVRGFREEDSVTFDFTRADNRPFEDQSPPTAVPLASAKPAQGKEAAKPDAPPTPVAPARPDQGREAAKPDAPPTPVAPARPDQGKEAAKPDALPTPVAPARPDQGREAAKPVALPTPVAPAPAATIRRGGGKVRPAPGVPEQVHAAKVELPMARIEPGRDAKGFALRLTGVGEAPLAIFRRGKTLNVMVESADPLRLAEIPAALRGKVANLGVQPLAGAALLRLGTPSEAAFWLRRDGKDFVIENGRSEGSVDAFYGATPPLERAFDKAGREALEAKVGDKGQLHTVEDSETGAKLALLGAPAAAFLSPKALDFAEFSLQPTLSGLVVLLADEAVSLQRRPDSVLISHEIRLNLSALPAPAQASPERKDVKLMLDLAEWNEDRSGDIKRLENRLLVNAAETPRVTRSLARLRLARFYVANALYPEADTVLQLIVADDPKALGDKQTAFLRALVAAMAGRAVEANALLSEPLFSAEGEAQLLLGYLQAQALHFPQALALFREATAELDHYPATLQAPIRRAVIESAIEAEDPVFARDQLEAYGKLAPQYRSIHLQQLLAARLAEQQGRMDDALGAYTLAVLSPDREIEAEARLGKVAVLQAMGKIQPEDARAEYETLTMIWRRSDVEVKAQEKLGMIYASEGRWREAFLASQRASAIMPEHGAARRLEEKMAQRFEALFIRNDAEKLSKVETLAIYREFRQLIPAGRRGDEVARNLAERLVDLDLIGEATEILEHQVNNRLEGVARAAVATRLAVIYLDAREPQRALAALRASRLDSLPADLRRARQMLEARALGELHRADLAIELVADENGQDVERLRADIYWKGKLWREAGESYERLLGDAWQQKEPLSDEQRSDVLRAALAYALGDEKLSLDRLRGRYMGPMTRTEDSSSFNLITNDRIARPQDFRDVARAIVSADTLREFMAAYRKRYPESGGQARPQPAANLPRGETPQPVPAKS